MVYIRGGSKGCWTCRERRIKCDGARPAPCARCHKSGRECKGYEDGKFVHYVGESSQQTPLEQGRRRRRFPKSRLESGSMSSEAPETSDSTTRLPTISALSQHFHLPHSEATSTSTLITPLDFVRSMASSLTYPPVSRNDRVALRFIFSFSGPLLGRNHLTHGQFADFIPSRIGSDPTLDDAVACVNAATAEISRDPLDLTYSRAFYMRAIAHLRQALTDERTSRTSEVLIATLLLQIYELHTNDQAIGVIAHAGGAIRLIEARGPDAHREGIGKAILMSMQAPIISQALKLRHSCFLADGRWSGLIDELGPRRSGSATFPQCTPEASADLFKCSVHHPGLIEKAMNVDLADVRSVLAAKEAPSSPPQILLLALDQRARYLAWRNRYVPSLSIDFVADNEPDPDHEYNNMFQAIFDLPVHLSLITTDCLIRCILPEDRDQLQNLEELLRDVRHSSELPGHSNLNREIAALTKNIAHAYTYAYATMEGYPRYMNMLLDDFCDAAMFLPPDEYKIALFARKQLHELQAGFGQPVKSSHDE